MMVVTTTMTTADGVLGHGVAVVVVAVATAVAVLVGDCQSMMTTQVSVLFGAKTRQRQLARIRIRIPQLLLL